MCLFEVKHPTDIPRYNYIHPMYNCLFLEIITVNIVVHNINQLQLLQ